LEEFATINQDVIDAVGEITNMICGVAKRELSEKGLVFDMASPLVFTGKDLVLQKLKQEQIEVLPFKTPEGEFVIESSFVPKITA